MCFDCSKISVKKEKLLSSLLYLVRSSLIFRSVASDILWPGEDSDETGWDVSRQLADQLLFQL